MARKTAQRGWRWSVTAGLLGLALGTAERRLAAAGLDHSPWDRILKATVTEDGWVDYGKIRKGFASELKAYLRALGEARLSDLPTREEKMAFWINAYNAICVQKLLDHGLPPEVPHAVFFGKNIFKEATYRVAGKVRALDEIEHEILRKRFRDPRLHAALVCGASSCPRLRPEAYAGERLERQLDEEARRWVQSEKTRKGERKNYLDRQAGVYHVSKIFDWFEEDFGGTGGVLAFLRRYGTEDDRAYLAQHQVRFRYLDYDWRLNRQ